jgi:hypothetical protein
MVMTQVVVDFNSEYKSRFVCGFFLFLKIAAYFAPFLAIEVYFTKMMLSTTENFS